jgi:hypothetical protein
MAIEIPDDWPPSGWVENPPIAHLDAQATDPVSGQPGFTPTRWQVANWQTTREIAASSLPGQVRAKTGLSVGTAKALIKRDPEDFPWKKRAIYELTGQAAQILIAPEGRTKIPTGQFQVAEISGDLSTLGVQVDLDEKTIEGRDTAANVRGWNYYDSSAYPGDVQEGNVLGVDPAWWVSELARQIGYGVSPQPGENGYTPYLDIPFQGSLVPAYPRGTRWSMSGDSAPVTWAELDGVLAAESYLQTFYPGVEGALLQSATYTLDLHGSVEFRWNTPDEGVNDGVVTLYIRNRTFSDTELYVELESLGADGTFNDFDFMTLDVPIPGTRPYGIQVQWEVFSTSDNWTSMRVRARRDPAAAWSGWLVHDMPFSPGPTEDPYRLGITKSEDARLARLSIVDSNSDNTMSVDEILGTTEGPNGRIYLEPLLGTITSPWLSPDLSTWAAVQEVVEAWQGALITDIYGDLHLLNRLTLTGVGVGEELPIDVGLKFEDLPWTANHTDQADRLVVRYRPATVVTVNEDDYEGRLPIVWEAQEIVATSPGGNDVFFNTDYLYLMWTAELPWVQKGSPDFNEVYHAWDAYRYSNGTGTHMAPNTNVGIRIEQITVSTWKVYIDNRTNAPFYMVDSTGTPWLKVRSFYHMDQTQETFVERGASAGDAKNPLTIDLSNYVQNDEDANALADFIWGRVNHRAWRADTINTVPDYRLDLGTVVEITHARTGVRSNALVTKVQLDGQPGQVTQKIDLVLIPPTWEDFDEAWAADTWVEFDALWANYTWQDFDRTPTATTVAEIEEAL